ncbi:MAG: UDP-N-acetylglucosamine 1-carboxyvinyltransferase [Christensenellales bacterium]
MQKLVIVGERQLQGETSVSGGKNSSLAIVPAALLADGPCTIENVPDIQDIHVLKDILRSLGASVSYSPSERLMVVDPRGVNSCTVSYDLARQLRASYYFMGALLGRLNEANVPLPGGCDIGARPIDQHRKGFVALGVEVNDMGGALHLKGRPVGTRINFDMITVGGTINVMLAAAKAKGYTVLTNAAREPHVVDVANFLNSIGARVRGAGTDTIRIEGREHLRGGIYTVIPDQIETGTFMIAAAATRGDVAIRGTIPTHMEALTAKLLEMGVRVSHDDDIIRVQFGDIHRNLTISTQEYPGFPTDLQQPISALLTRAKGISVVTENIFSNRFKHLQEMERMGASVRISGNVATIEGVTLLRGAQVSASDLRCGAALVIAGLMARGTTEVDHVEYIDRGYEHFEDKLNALGADITRVTVED